MNIDLKTGQEFITAEQSINKVVDHYKIAGKRELMKEIIEDFEKQWQESKEVLKTAPLETQQELQMDTLVKEKVLAAVKEFKRQRNWL